MEIKQHSPEQPMIKEEIKGEIQKYFKTNEKENTIYQNLRDTAKAVLRGKFIAIQSHLKKQEKSQIKNLILHLKQLEKEEQKNPKVSGRKEIIKIRNEKGEVTTDTAEIQNILRDYYKQLYANKMDNLGEMDKFLERNNLPRLNQEEIENMNRPITSNEIETD